MVIVSKQMEVPSTGKQLSDWAEGDIVQIPENGVPVEFYVAKHNYESELNGPGRTLVVRTSGFTTCKWGYTISDKAWSTCYALEYLNETYKAVLSEHVVDLIGTTSYLYKDSYYGSVASRLDPIFLLSITEMGFGGTEGYELPNAYIYVNNPVTQKWTRSLSRQGPYYIDYTGTLKENFSNVEYNICPSFTLPSTTNFDPDTNIIIG